MAKKDKPSTEDEPGTAASAETSETVAPTGEGPLELKEPIREGALPEAEVSDRASDVVGTAEVETPEPSVSEKLLSSEAPQVVEAQPHSSGGAGFLGLVTGGIVAGLIGFGAALYLFPEGWPNGNTTAALEGQVAEQAREIATLKDQIAAIGPDEALKAEVSNALSETQSLTDRLGALDGRVATLEQTPAPTASPALDEVQQEIQAIRDELAAQRGSGESIAEQIAAAAEAASAKLKEAEAQAEAMRAEAAAAAAMARSAGALALLQAAVEAGTPFAEPLAEVTDNGVSVPAVLVDAAATGVPSMSSLQASFPEVARAALDASIRAATADASWTERLQAFMKVQTGARSLEAREGNDPDAVLSRAEAAVRNGDLGAALTEIEALPPEGQAAMADWLDAARKRQAAVDAASALTASVRGN